MPTLAAAPQVSISYLEIYNEVGYDLLNPDREVKGLEDLPQVRGPGRGPENKESGRAKAAGCGSRREQGLSLNLAAIAGWCFSHAGCYTCA
jgi:hypothetical protein